MKYKDKVVFFHFLRNYVYYSDGFWILDNKVVTEEEIRRTIHSQGKLLLESDVTDLLDELRYNRHERFDVRAWFEKTIQAKKSRSPKKSLYFSIMDDLYPGNKFRQIFNYYLFSRECYCFILLGDGQTGKTTMIDILAEILGKQFFRRTDVQKIQGAHGTSSLEGKILIEIAEAQNLDHGTANLLKSIITRDTVSVNPKFKDIQDMTPQGKTVMTCNFVPSYKKTDDGLYRRFLTVHMDVPITTQIPGFIDLIKGDIPNIIYEAERSPFHIDLFRSEQYELFRLDHQYGFGYGEEPLINYQGYTVYDKYVSMCKAFNFHPRNKDNFENFARLAKKYEERMKDAACGLISGESMAESGSPLYDDSDLAWSPLSK